MTTLEITLIVVLWIVLGAFNWAKQWVAETGSGEHDAIWFFVGAFLFAPIFFIGAIIRQVIIEDWK